MSSNSGWSGPGLDNPPNPSPTVSAPQTLSALPEENPPFGGAEVVLIGVVMFVVPVIVSLFLIMLVQKRVYPQFTVEQLSEQKPWLLLGLQFAWFAVVAICLVGFAKKLFGETLWQAIRWNWPVRRWPGLIGIAAAMLVALQGLEHLLPLPPKSPFDQFFSRPLDAYAFAFFAICFGPFMEEMFFRGFLYPVLARRLGVLAGVVLTALPFALIHEPEYKAWGPVLIIFLVGMVLTLVRAKMKSVAASFIVHSIYNGVPVVFVLIASHGFRHFEKLAQ